MIGVICKPTEINKLTGGISKLLRLILFPLLKSASCTENIFNEINNKEVPHN